MKSLSWDDAFIDDEFIDRGYDAEQLENILDLQIIPTESIPSKESSEWMKISRTESIHKGKKISPSVTRAWGQIRNGSLAYGRSDGNWDFFRKSGLTFSSTLPSSSLGEGRDGEKIFQSLAWMADKLHEGKRMDLTSISFNGLCYSCRGSDLIEKNPCGEPLVKVDLPEDARARLRFVREAWGEEATETICQMAFYLVSPFPSIHFFTWSDQGGTGKTSWQDLFYQTFPSITALGLSADDLSQGGFTAGAALVPLIGKKVCFSDEAGALTSKQLSAIAGLTTGATKTVRYGGGKAGSRSFSLKMVFTSNQQDELPELEAVGRRRVSIPLVLTHEASWWQEPAGDPWPGQSNWDVLFSRETLFTEILHGKKVWEKRGGKWPSPSAYGRHVELMDETIDAIHTLTDHPSEEKGIWKISWQDLLKDLTAWQKTHVKKELKLKCGLGTRSKWIDGKTIRAVCVEDSAKWSAVEARIL